MPSFKDHFSAHAGHYASARPTYSPALASLLAGLSPARARALDCGTGNGQAAVLLAEEFDEVVATDASAEQIAHAEPHSRVVYRVAPAEDSGEPAASFDLVTVAQALHWMDHDRLFAEVARVLRPGGIFAAISYKLFEAVPEADAHIEDFYRALDPYWPPERRHVEEGYASIAFPGEAVAVDPPPMEALWTAADALAYLDTWSATRRCAQATGTNPLDAIAGPVRAAWGEERRRVVWPLTLVVRRLG